ncbi:hypothetical protein COEREDRAFT_83399 [Coemansia reversa NRRL 1564]|uniref:Uncharacterized protein n=1 Tax=Coemansia reversa (strain ATCC 12441 / NRRL 1564) TaxID=763665 RepID=A0A2G5B3H6_COERN|nr:hypothetical protein COEREDRAFT_83399 [Coemansia reversa NRRL 1564]|eukprot:PIA13572.1 hypothetical protein COEREDRAFT_83399 [Coemansia reversa NRRL 1564]
MLHVRATLAYIHPLYLVAFIKYDPALIFDNPVSISITDLDLHLSRDADSTARLATGNSVTVVTGTISGGLEIIKAAVSRRKLLSTSTCSAFEDEIGTVFNADNIICNLWLRLLYCTHSSNNKTHIGLDISLVLPTLRQLQTNDIIFNFVRILDVEFISQSLATAKALGVSDNHAQNIIQSAPNVRSVLKDYNFMFINGGTIISESYNSNIFISEIAGKSIHTLDDVAKAARDLKSKDLSEFNKKVTNNLLLDSGEIPGCDVKIHGVLLSGEDVIQSIRTNDQYFPAWQLSRGPHIDDNWVWEEL